MNQLPERWALGTDLNVNLSSTAAGPEHWLSLSEPPFPHPSKEGITTYFLGLGEMKSWKTYVQGVLPLL